MKLIREKSKGEESEGEPRARSLGRQKPRTKDRAQFSFKIQ